MKAAKIVGNQHIEVVEVPIPEIKPNECLVKMKSVALCRSDLYRYHGTTCFDDDSASADWTPGHEPAGIIEKVGSMVTNVKPGDRVGIFMFDGCGKCDYCKHGLDQLCKQFKCIGFQTDGAHADYLVMPADKCLPIPDELSYRAAALLTDVGGGLYTTCRNLNVKGGKFVVIAGAGPMGVGGVMMAKGFGGTVISVDIDPKRLEFAKSVGADYTINSAEENVVERVLEITHGRGADIAIECTGIQPGADIVFSTIKPLGWVGIMGENSDCNIDLSLNVIHKRLTILGCWTFEKGDWDEIVRFVLENNIPIEKLATHVYKIEDADEAYKVFDSHIAQKVVFEWD